MVKPSILVVDDDQTTRLLLTHVLHPLYHVRCACDGEEALQLVEAQRPDLIISDLMMPRKDGFTFLEVLRARPDTQSIPFIVLTVESEGYHQVKRDGLAITDYIMKPFSVHDLLGRIARVLS